MWETKRAEELELAARDMEEVVNIFISITINITITIFIFNIIIVIIVIIIIVSIHHQSQPQHQRQYCVPSLQLSFMLTTFISRASCIQVKEMSRIKMFGRPGNGAPTGFQRITLIFFFLFHKCNIQLSQLSQSKPNPKRLPK